MIKHSIPSNYIRFDSCEAAAAFGRRYYGDWLYSFHPKNEFHGYFSEDNFWDYYYKSKHGEEKMSFIKAQAKIYKAFCYYCGGTQGPMINQYLRNPVSYYDFYFTPEKLNPIIELMDAEIKKNQLPFNIVAFRFLNKLHLCNTLGKSKIRKGDTILDNGFMSVGLFSDSLASEFGSRDTILTLLIPKGYPSIYLDFISERPWEQELLLQRGTILKVLEVKKSILKNSWKILCEVLLQ